MTTLPNEVPGRVAPGRRALAMHNSGYWFAGFLAVTLFSFWPSYVGKLPARMDVYTHVHAVLMTAWFGLLIAQPLLIRRGKRSIHRILGRFSYVLVPVIAVSWLLLIHVRARTMADDVFEREGKFFYLATVSAALFLAAWGMAVITRKTPPLHARYMVCTAFAVVDAVAARILFVRFPPLSDPLMYQVIGFGITDLLILMLFLIDRGPHRRAFLHMFVLFTVLHLFWFTGGQTEGWLAVVRWFRSLSLT